MTKKEIMERKNKFVAKMKDKTWSVMPIGHDQVFFDIERVKVGLTDINVSTGSTSYWEIIPKFHYRNDLRGTKVFIAEKESQMYKCTEFTADEAEKEYKRTHKFIWVPFVDDDIYKELLKEFEEIAPYFQIEFHEIQGQDVFLQYIEFVDYKEVSQKKELTFDEMVEIYFEKVGEKKEDFTVRKWVLEIMYQIRDKEYKDIDLSNLTYLYELGWKLKKEYLEMEV